MSLDKDGLKAVLLDAMSQNPTDKESAMDALAGALVDYITENLEVVIPAGTVLTGGIGQYTPTKNGPVPPQTGVITCEVS